MRWMRWTTKVPVLAIIGVCLLLFPSLILHNPYVAILAGVGILFIIIDGIYFLGMRSNKFEESKLNMIVSFAIFPLLLIFLILGLSFIIYALARTKHSKIENTNCEFFNTEISYKFIGDVKEKLEILGVDETNKTFDLNVIDFANNLKRQSVLHFDLTKDNIKILGMKNLSKETTFFDKSTLRFEYSKVV